MSFCVCCTRFLQKESRCYHALSKIGCLCSTCHAKVRNEIVFAAKMSQCLPVRVDSSEMVAKHFHVVSPSLLKCTRHDAVHQTAQRKEQISKYCTTKLLQFKRPLSVANAPYSSTQSQTHSDTPSTLFNKKRSYLGRTIHPVLVRHKSKLSFHKSGKKAHRDKIDRCSVCRIPQ